jgi:hypothetical protein
MFTVVKAKHQPWENITVLRVKRETNECDCNMAAQWRKYCAKKVTKQQENPEEDQTEEEKVQEEKELEQQMEKEDPNLNWAQMREKNLKEYEERKMRQRKKQLDEKKRYWEDIKLHHADCSYKKWVLKMRSANDQRKGYSGGQFFVQETHYQGQPYSQFDNAEVINQQDPTTFRYQDLQAQSEVQQLNGVTSNGDSRVSGLTQMDRNLPQRANSKGSMSTLSEKNEDQENASPKLKKMYRENQKFDFSDSDKEDDNYEGLNLHKIASTIIEEEAELEDMTNPHNQPFKNCKRDPSNKSEDLTPQRAAIYGYNRKRKQSMVGFRLSCHDSNADSYVSRISHDDTKRMKERNRILSEAAKMDNQLSNQINMIQQLRRATKDLIQSSMDVIDCYREAKERCDEGIRKRIFESFGNEHFVKNRFNSHSRLMGVSGMRQGMDLRFADLGNEEIQELDGQEETSKQRDQIEEFKDVG